MTLRLLDLEIPDTPLPSPAEGLLGRAAAFVDAFTESRLDDPIAGFVPSNYEKAYRALAVLVDSHLTPGRSFCEWGSGLGIVACLAASLGFRARGIEIERDLVTAARKFATQEGLDVEYVCGSFVPTGGEDIADRANAIDKFAWLITGGADGHEELGLDPEDFDVVFAYPWPGEEDVIDELFDTYGCEGALLVTYHGREGMRIQRKLSRLR